MVGEARMVGGRGLFGMDSCLRRNDGGGWLVVGGMVGGVDWEGDREGCPYGMVGLSEDGLVRGLFGMDSCLRRNDERGMVGLGEDGLVRGLFGMDGRAATLFEGSCLRRNNGGGWLAVGGMVGGVDWEGDHEGCPYGGGEGVGWRGGGSCWDTRVVVGGGAAAWTRVVALSAGHFIGWSERGSLVGLFLRRRRGLPG